MCKALLDLRPEGARCRRHDSAARSFPPFSRPQGAALARLRAPAPSGNGGALDRAARPSAPPVPAVRATAATATAVTVTAVTSITSVTATMHSDDVSPTVLWAPRGRGSLEGGSRPGGVMGAWQQQRGCACALPTEKNPMFVGCPPSEPRGEQGEWGEGCQEVPGAVCPRRLCGACWGTGSSAPTR